MNRIKERLLPCLRGIAPLLIVGSFSACSRWIVDRYTVVSIRPFNGPSRASEMMDAVKIAATFGATHGFKAEDCPTSEQFYFCKMWTATFETCGQECARDVAYVMRASSVDGPLTLEFHHGKGYLREDAVVSVREDLVAALKQGIPVTPEEDPRTSR